MIKKLLVIAMIPTVLRAGSVRLDELDLNHAECGWGKVRASRSVDNNPLTIGAKVFARGIGTHADSDLYVRLAKGSRRFRAFVGVDSEVKELGNVIFNVFGDDRKLWTSGVMKGGQSAKAVDLDVSGVDILRLNVNANGPISYDHADWADAVLEVTDAKPKAVPVPVPDLTPFILTPPAGPKPRINGARVFGVRPESPFMFKVPASGAKPIKYSAEGLPDGLKIDAANGMIAGRLTKRGTYKAMLTCENTHGKASRALTIVVGDRICLTPPMGWNSWNCWTSKVSDEKVRLSARAMVESGLIDHGWTYINIDDTWQGKRGGRHNAIQGNKKFPDMKGLCDYVHSLGLKIGIYSTPWCMSYAGHIGGSSNSPGGEFGTRKYQHGKYRFDENDVRQWAEWGFDYLKYDWRWNDVKTTERMAAALRNSKRDIVYSLSNAAPFEIADDLARLSNAWRTTGDIRDRWTLGAKVFHNHVGVSDIWKFHERWQNHCGPGYYPDPDMMVLGKVSWSGTPKPTRLSADEQYTHMSMWCLWAAPLLLGCPLDDIDKFTLSLLTNDEVIEINQDTLCTMGRTVQDDGGLLVMVKPLEDGSKAVGLINFTDKHATVTALWDNLGLKGRMVARDLWRQKDLGHFDRSFEAKVNPHGVVLVRFRKP